MDDWEVFFYDDVRACVSSLSKYHAENCDIEPLVEAYPDVIYFYARLQMHKDWDFNEYPLPNDWTHNQDEPLFTIGENFEAIYISLDKEPNAFGETIQIKE